jgi:hypothetical protein
MMVSLRERIQDLLRPLSPPAVIPQPEELLRQVKRQWDSVG